MRVIACLVQNRGNNSFTLWALFGILPQYLVGITMKHFGKRTGFLSTVAVIATVLGTSASGQALRNANPPAETPPRSFTGNQYVDSQGCVFIRAGINGTVSWVPRVTRSRDQLCGFQPSLVANTRTAPDVVPVPPAESAPSQTPDVTTQQVAASTPAVVETPAPAPVQAAAAAPAPRVAPAAVEQSTENAVTEQPVSNAVAEVSAPPQSPSPQIIVPQAAPAPRVLTRAQACEGLTGVQPHLTSQRTGQPIDCGGETQQVASIAAPAAAAPTVAEPAKQRLSRADACTAMAASGRQYVSTTTGLPLQCGGSTQPAAPTTPAVGLASLSSDLQLPQQAYTNPLDAAPGAVTVPARAAPSRSATRRGLSQAPYSNPLDSAPGSTTFTPNVNTQVSNTTAATQTVTRARAQNRTVFQVITGQQGAPYSNPALAFAATVAPTVPAGFERSMGDGRLNTQRGLPVAAPIVRHAAQPLVQTNAVTTRAAAPVPQQGEQISGHRYVQVGTFEAREDAQSIAQSLRARGLPMRVGVFTQQGREMRVVLAGPFSNDRRLQSALSTTHGAGFSAAFTRR